jgi:hypothetical protein
LSYEVEKAIPKAIDIVKKEVEKYEWFWTKYNRIFM